MIFSPILGLLLYLPLFAGLLLTSPHLHIGYQWLFLKIFDGKHVSVGNLFDGFKAYGRHLGFFFWKLLWLWLWSMAGFVGFIIGFIMIVFGLFFLLDPTVGTPLAGLLLFLLGIVVTVACEIPVLIAHYRYALGKLIVVDQPEIPVTRVLDESKKMMAGRKWQFFCLQLSYLWWFVFPLISYMIGISFVIFSLETFFLEIFIGNQALFTLGMIVIGISGLLYFPIVLIISPKMMMAVAVFYRKLCPKGRAGEMNDQEAIIRDDIFEQLSLELSVEGEKENENES
jgi:uncharacterized membrane protein